MKELRSNSSNRKNVAEQKCTKGVSPTAFLRSPSPEGAKRLPYVKRSKNCFLYYSPIILTEYTFAIISDN